MDQNKPTGFLQLIEKVEGVAFEIALSPTFVMSRNCSICTRQVTDSSYW